MSLDDQIQQNYNLLFEKNRGILKYFCDLILKEY